MASKKTAGGAKSGAKKAAGKPAAEKDPKDAPLGQAGNPGADEVTADVEVAKGGNSIEPTGKFEVVEIKPDNFRMFNERGQAVSGVVVKGDTDENGKPALAKLIRDARRANALRKQREIRTPRGHEQA